MAQWRIEVTGLRQILDALKEVDTAGAKNITDAITKAGKSVATEASYMTPGTRPISNWGPWTQNGRDLSYDGSTAAAGFKLKKSNFRRKGVSAGIGWDVIQSNPGGAIFEVMGTGKRVTTVPGAHLVEVIADRFPRRMPRSLFGAYYAVIDPNFTEEIRDQIIAAARKAGLV